MGIAFGENICDPSARRGAVWPCFEKLEEYLSWSRYGLVAQE